MLRSFSQIHEISNLVPRVFSFSGKQEDPGGEIGHLPWRTLKAHPRQVNRGVQPTEQKKKRAKNANTTVLYWKGRIGNRKSETGIEDRGRVIGDR